VTREWERAEMRRRGDVGYVMQDGKLPSGFEGPDMPKDMWKNNEEGDDEEDGDEDDRCVCVCVCVCACANHVSALL
jgi:hypothetical protein